MRSKTGCNRDPRGTPLVIGCNEELWQPNWMKIHTILTFHQCGLGSTPDSSQFVG